MRKKTKGRLALVGIAIIAMLSAAACVPPQIENVFRTTMYADGHLSVRVTDGFSGPVIAEASGPVSLALLRPTASERAFCLLNTFNPGPCATWDGTMTPQGDLAGVTGPWKVSLGYEMPGCFEILACTNVLQLGLWSAESPDGLKKFSYYDGGTLINGTDGCPGKGVLLPGSDVLPPDLSTYYHVKLAVCSAEIFDAYSADR